MGYKLLVLFVLFMMLSFAIKAQSVPGVFLSFEEMEKIRQGFFELTNKIDDLEKQIVVLRIKLACS